MNKPNLVVTIQANRILGQSVQIVNLGMYDTDQSRLVTKKEEWLNFEFLRLKGRDTVAH